MIENKYYAPKLEEFHIGFQYEWLDEKGNWHKEDSPKEISQDGFEEQTYGLRVKYLNREDIEKCGFVTGGEVLLSARGPMSFRYEDYYITFASSYPDQGLCWDNNITIEKYFKSNTGKDNYINIVLFKGLIKNISELKIILSQIGVKYVTK